MAAMERQGAALQKQGVALRNQAGILKLQGETMQRQYEIMDQLKTAMESFADTSSDTRTRLARVEELLEQVVIDVEELKDAS